MKTHAKSSSRGQTLLAQMRQIPVIVQGKLTVRRKGDKVTGYKLQRWLHGRNQTRHIPATMLDTVRKGTEGYDEFMNLAQQYVEVREEEALQGAADSKKKESTKP